MRELRTKNVIKNFSKEPIDFMLLAIVFTMLALGIVMVLSASSPTSLAETGNSYNYVKTQAFSAVLGIGLMYIASKFDYRLFKKMDILIYLGVFILLSIVGIIGVAEGRSEEMVRFRFY